MKRRICALGLILPLIAQAGPESAIRDFGSSQIKKGVRSIGMGGDGATWGNYSLVYRDAGTQIVDYGSSYFKDNGNQFNFSAVGFTTPKFWENAALYVVAMSQTASSIATWSANSPSSSKPPSTGNGSNQALFVKFAKPVSETVSVGVLLSYEQSQMALDPLNGTHSIDYSTSWMPSGGAGVSYQPESWLLVGARVILNNDWETRVDGTGTTQGLLRSNEYRAGVSVTPWSGGLLDAGVSVLDRSSAVDGTASVTAFPTYGFEQELIEKKYWLRMGLDETSFTAGGSLKLEKLKLDLAYLNNIAAARLGGIFGNQSDSFILTLTFNN